jgi:hypothetical protein
MSALDDYDGAGGLPELGSTVYAGAGGSTVCWNWWICAGIGGVLAGIGGFIPELVALY